MSVGRLLSLQQLTSLRLVSLSLQQQLQQQQQQQCHLHVRKTGFQSDLVRMFATGISKKTVAKRKKGKSRTLLHCFLCWVNDIMLIAGVEGPQQQEGSWMPGWLKSRLPGDYQ